MIYQIKEKAIYSESDAIYFNEEGEFGDIINTYFPDSTGISVGSVIYQSDNENEVYGLKKQLEILRIKAIDEDRELSFFIRELSYEFYISNGFMKLQKLYRKEFDFDLFLRNADLMVGEEFFYIPDQASDDQIIAIQKALNLHFYIIEEASEEDETVNNKIDWNNRLAILHSNKSEFNKKQKLKASAILEKDFNYKKQKETEYLEEKLRIEQKGSQSKEKPWWKFW
jgi:hypothetical protein